MKPFMPKQTKLTRERLEAKLEASLLWKLGKYCEYLDSDRDYIVGQALEVVFRKDKGFGVWLDAQGAGKSSSLSDGGSIEVRRHRRNSSPGTPVTATGSRAVEPGQ